MINLNECKFGDHLTMRNGQTAIYVGQSMPSTDIHFCVAAHEECGYMMLYAKNNGVMEYMGDRDYDIVDKQEDKA